MVATMTRIIKPGHGLSAGRKSDES
jgi:hypothetical protein